MYSATGKDVLFLIFLIFAEKNLSFHISSFNESTGFGLLKASPVEFVKYPFSGLQNKILFSKVLWIRQYSKRIVLISFSWYNSPTEILCLHQLVALSLKLPPQLSRTDWDCF